MSPATHSAYDTRPIDSPVQPCNACHWFRIELVPAADNNARKAWWPKRKRKAYPSESMKIALAGVGAEQTLDSGGKFEAKGLPGGDATVQFNHFYKDLEAALASGRRF